MVISSIVAGTVESCPSTTLAAESPTSTRSTPAASTIRPVGWSYAVIITIGRRSDFMVAQIGQRELHESSTGMLSISRVEPKRAAPMTMAPGRGSAGSKVSGSTTAR